MAGVDGNFLGGFGQGFAQIYQLKSEKDQRDKIASLQSKLLEQQLKANQDRITAQTKLVDLMTGDLGEFQPSGTKTTPDGHQITQYQNTGGPYKTLSQVLADPQGQLAALQAGYLSPRDLMGGGGGKEPSLIQTLRDIGIDPMSEKGREIAIQSLTGGEVGQQLDLLKANMLEIQMREKQGELDKANADALKDKAMAKFGIQRVLSDSREIFQLQKDLQGTLSTAGVPFGDFMQMTKSAMVPFMGSLGFDPKNQQALIEKRDRLKKLLGKGLLETLQDMKNAGGGRLTNNLLAAVQRSTLDINNQPWANDQILADRLTAALQMADSEGIDLPDRQEIESFIQMAKSTHNSDTAPNIVFDVPQTAKDVAQFTKEQLQQLAASGKELSEEVRKAAADRWEELNRAQ